MKATGQLVFPKTGEVWYNLCDNRSVFRRSEVTFYAIVRVLLLGMQIQI